MAAITGVDGDVIKGGTQICETTKWAFEPTSNLFPYITTKTGGYTRREAGARDGAGMVEGKWDPATPVYGTAAGQVREGDSVTLLLYLDDFQYLSVPSIIKNFRWEVDFDNGDLIAWSFNFEIDGIWSANTVESSGFSSSSSSTSSTSSSTSSASTSSSSSGSSSSTSTSASSVSYSSNSSSSSVNSSSSSTSSSSSSGHSSSSSSSSSGHSSSSSSRTSSSSSSSGHSSSSSSSSSSSNSSSSSSGHSSSSSSTSSSSSSNSSSSSTML